MVWYISKTAYCQGFSACFSAKQTLFRYAIGCKYFLFTDLDNISYNHTTLLISKIHQGGISGEHQLDRKSVKGDIHQG